MAHGIAVAGPGIGVAVPLPVAAGLIEAAGWRSASLAFLGASLAGVVFVWLMTSGPAIVVPARGPGGRTRAGAAAPAGRAAGRAGRARRRRPRAPVRAPVGPAGHRARRDRAPGDGQRGDDRRPLGRLLRRL